MGVFLSWLPIEDFSPTLAPLQAKGWAAAEIQPWKNGVAEGLQKSSVRTYKAANHLGVDSTIFDITLIMLQVCCLLRDVSNPPKWI